MIEVFSTLQTLDGVIPDGRLHDPPASFDGGEPAFDAHEDVITRKSLELSVTEARWGLLNFFSSNPNFLN